MERIDKKTALKMYKEMPLLELGKMADSLRKELHPENIVTFVIDRNINYTNICINKCSFCAFYKDIDNPESYLLKTSEILQKIQETVDVGGTAILIQGGLHPDLNIDYYIDLLKTIKKEFDINIHGFSPPEITHIAKVAGLSIKDTIKKLIDAGLGSIPGGGAEVLSDRIREAVSPKKIKTEQWMAVMAEAHEAGLKTTATMMFGCGEGPEDIIEHLDAARSQQDKSHGFTAFIPWSFQPENTALGKGFLPATGVDYLRVLALSRIYLDNIKNIQASWVTQGIKMAQVALRFGANDLGSTMLEENVVRAAGVSFKVSQDDLINAGMAAGFKVMQRDTFYNRLKEFN
ncbi:MAG: dehypoxanthine futalosine cyclase [Nitrospirae bacterium]|nr:dehypoxanthine futalosine cyclase [Nitrospirota bacterium]